MKPESAGVGTEAPIIRELPDAVINQIKAGEVVERPLSVVKELVENAIDADADCVTIDIFDGGKAMIRIIDTGRGMSAEDAALSVRRHATSKLASLDDLEHIATFGFRGEALASIASVSRFVMRTRRASDSAATQVEVDANGLVSTQTVASPPGTEIEVAELFYNTPARQKFMRHAATEYAHIHDFVQAMALAYPSVSWSLSHNRKRVLHFRAASSLEERARAVLGPSFSEFCSVSFEKGSFRVDGFAGLPQTSRAVPQHFLVFVNGRLLRDKVIRAGVFQAYAGLIMKGLVPSAILFVQCDPRSVDVNAHPNKTEVRFRDPMLVQDLVSLAVAAAVRQAVQDKGMPLRVTLQDPDVEPSSLDPSAAPLASVVADASKAPSKPESGPFRPQPQAIRPVVLSSGPRFEAQAMAAGTRADVLFETRGAASPLGRAYGASMAATGADAPKRHGFAATASSPLPAADALVTSVEAASAAAPLRYVGQVQKLYLIFECTETRELWFVDQHAFHERILFEGYLRSADAPIARQAFLTPLFVPLPDSLGPLVTAHASYLERLGFETEWCESMGRLAVHAYPAFLDVNKVATVFDEVLARLLAAIDPDLSTEHPLVFKARDLRSHWMAEGRSTVGMEPRDVYHLMYATIACHAAVRAGQELRPEQVHYLVARARSVDFSAHCPHGRPVMRRFSSDEMGAWFERV